MSEDKRTEGIAGDPPPEGGVGDEVAGAEERRRVASGGFVRTGVEARVGELLWGLSVWYEGGKTLKTHLANMLFCYGGFVQIPEADYTLMMRFMDEAIT